MTVLEASGSVLDANLLGSKGLFLSHGARTFADLGLQGDAATIGSLITINYQLNQPQAEWHLGQESAGKQLC